GVPIFYIVPEQMTFQQEYALFDEQINGSIRAQVVSFSRLAWRVLQETGGAAKQFISSTGTPMILRKIINEHYDTFPMLQKQIDYVAENIPLQQKLHDLHIIYRELTRALQMKYIDGEDQLQLLVEKIKATPFLQRALIYIDGFYRFTPKELAIIEQLLLTTD